ncbi:28S ribosomal protein S21, mitochondrial-like [Oppia nitens]|uniref:28S ribosomal protein S21, mitochondrial-like n=1 Tax=Oppia nitens TaxID=1686743 RepID=UPI0023DB87D1|nr:28S ribosomal protein S21, mitochondrial-like [Oppia nitens]
MLVTGILCVRNHLPMDVKFIGRTVLVRNGDLDGALRVVNKIMGNERLFDIYRRTRTYEKPWNTRRRVNWELCKSIYNEDMDRKIKFVMRTNRLDRDLAVKL